MFPFIENRDDCCICQTLSSIFTIWHHSWFYFVLRCQIDKLLTFAKGYGKNEVQQMEDTLFKDTRN